MSSAKHVVVKEDLVIDSECSDLHGHRYNVDGGVD